MIFLILVSLKSSLESSINNKVHQKSHSLLILLYNVIEFSNIWRVSVQSLLDMLHRIITYIFGIAKILLDFLQKKILKRDFVWLATCLAGVEKKMIEEETKFIAMVTVAHQQCIMPRNLQLVVERISKRQGYKTVG